ncbi:hypothetical protein PsorP6_008708 [Peronosclerospora sorghi]|uniref:Uncharacterized protein n=1 Tax=Peronosclerospora sorghi TaxID=230839 RepID=A0ACC0W0J8_9STRA|nr:hypothetical protein PsorP6_008708 [Peronosclerospora sorghi]
MPVFSVGEATSRELLHLGGIFKGDDAGSADMLSEYLHHNGGLPADFKWKPMMFLCGDKRRDVLPDSFRSAETCALQNIAIPDECRVPDWVVFFSPIGLEAVKHLPLPWESIRKEEIGRHSTLCNLIAKQNNVNLAPGKTTATALHEHAVATEKPFWEADVTAPKPTPESLADAIFAFQAEHKLDKIQF